MAESILVTGKKISSMELVTNVIGNEKIPTGQPDDLAVTTNQIADHTIARGDLASQEDLSQVEVSLGTQITDLVGDLAAEEAARIAADNLKVDKDGSVSSVAGRVGDVLLAPSDVLVEGFGSQEDVNKYVPKPFLSGYTYGLGERVVLNDGEVVKSLVDGNMGNPNVDMIGWVSTVSDSLSGTIQTFNTTEAGVDPVTGVANGAYFNVRSSNDELYVDEYQNVGGVATPSGKSYPSSNAKWDASQVVDASGLNQQEVNTALNSSYYIAESYGIKPSLTVDNSEQIQSLIDYVSSNGGGTIQFGRGIYNIGSGLVIKTLVSIVGCGSNSTLFHCNSDDDIVALDVLARFGYQSGSDVAYSLPFLRDFAVINKGVNKKGTGIWLKSFHRCTMSGVTIRGFERGLDTSGATWSSKIIGNWFVLNKYGIYNDATDANWKFIGDDGVGTIVNTGANGATIAYNEIQGNDFGIFNPYHHGHTAWIAHGLNIDNNIIEGNNFAGIVYTVHNSGINITKNYFERNSRSSTIDLATATLSVDDDATQYAATIIFNSRVAGVRGNIDNNHWGTGEKTSGGFDVYAIYHDRNAQVRYSGNNGNVPGFCAKQRSLDYNQAGFIDIGNNFVGNIFDSATELRILRIHRNGSKIPSLKTTDFEAAEVKATSLSEAGFVFSGTSTTATADLAAIPTGFYRGYMFNTSPTSGYPIENQICTIEGYKGVSYTSTYQRLSFRGGLVAVRRELADGNWSTPVLETAKILSATLGAEEVAIPHGLNYTPKVSGVVIKADASVWQSKAPDATNVYFTASASVSVDIAVI